MEGDEFVLKIVQTYTYFTSKCFSKTKYLLGFSDSHIFHIHLRMLVHARSKPLPTLLDLWRTSSRARLLCVWVNKGLNDARFRGKASN